MGRAIVRKPKLFLFDEPLSNLDAQLRTSMRIELKKLQQRLQATIIYVTHDQVEAMTLGDRIVVLEGGRVRQLDPPDRIYDAPADPFVASFIGTPPMNLWHGTLTTRDDQTIFRSDGMDLPLPATLFSHKPPLESAVTFGIRPEDIHLQKAADAIGVEALVEFIEDLGADLLLHCRAGVLQLIVRAVRGTDTRPGQAVRLFFPYSKLHVFIDDRRLDLSSPLPS
jgi:ABC-type sugar transport system ATPase subunit